MIFFCNFFAIAQVCSTGTLISSSTSYCENNPGISYLILDDNQVNKDFYFDNFSKYTRGITMGGSTILKVTVRTATPPPLGSCKWKLVMGVDNFGYVSDDEWETIGTYGLGTGSNKPDIGLLKVRITNGCQTPANNGAWQSFPTDMSTIDIVNPAVDLNPNGTLSCTSPVSGSQVNGPGTYLGPDYSEFTFVIDYRITPEYVHTPGTYKLKLSFCLVEK